MSGPYTALHPDTEDAGIAYIRRDSASFDGRWLKIHLCNNMEVGALYEDTFMSGDILWSQPVSGAPSLYRLGLNTASVTFSESLFSNDPEIALGWSGGVSDPVAGRYILPHGIVDSLVDPWANPVTY